MRTHLLLDLLRSLPEHPTQAELEPLAQALIAKAGPKPYPLKSVAATLRTHRKTILISDDTVRRLCCRAGEILEEQRRLALAPAETAAEYCGEHAAAALLGDEPARLRRRMIEPAQRRAHGYPLWDGSEFRFPLAALRAETRSTYLASLPGAEPAPEHLPDWCRRERAAGEPSPLSGSGPSL
jgi:hypothetical protein